MRSPPLAFQLREAWQGSGLTHEQLCVKAGLDVSADSLSRKLAGKQPLTTDEAERLAQALLRQLVWSPDVGRRARRKAA